MYIHYELIFCESLIKSDIFVLFSLAVYHLLFLNENDLIQSESINE
jgi:hypothetical protein